MLVLADVSATSEPACGSADSPFIQGVEFTEKRTATIWERNETIAVENKNGIFFMEGDMYTYYNSLSSNTWKQIAASSKSIYQLPDSNPIYTVNETGNNSSDHDIVDLIQLNDSFIIFAENSGRLMGWNRETNEIKPWAVKCDYDYTPGSFYELKPICVHYGAGYKALKLIVRPRFVDNTFCYLFEYNGQTVAECFRTGTLQDKKSSYHSPGQFYNRLLYVTPTYCYRDVTIINQTHLRIDGTYFQTPAGWLLNTQSRYRQLMLQDRYLLMMATETATNLTGVLLAEMDEGKTRLLLKSSSTSRVITGIGVQEDYSKYVTVSTTIYCRSAGLRYDVTRIKFKRPRVYSRDIISVPESPVRETRIRQTTIKAGYTCLRASVDYHERENITKSKWAITINEDYYDQPGRGKIIKIETDLYEKGIRDFGRLLITTEYTVYTVNEDRNPIYPIRLRNEAFNYSSSITISQSSPFDRLTDTTQFNDTTFLMLKESGTLLMVDRTTNRSRIISSMSILPRDSTALRLLPHNNMTLRYLAKVGSEPRNVSVRLLDGQTTLKQNLSGTVYNCVRCSWSLKIQLIQSANNPSSATLSVDDVTLNPPPGWRYNMKQKYRILNYKDRLIFSFGESELNGRDGVLMTDLRSNDTVVLFSTTIALYVSITALYIKEGNGSTTTSQPDLQFSLYISTTMTRFPSHRMEVYEMVFSEPLRVASELDKTSTGVSMITPPIVSTIPMPSQSTDMPKSTRPTDGITWLANTSTTDTAPNQTRSAITEMVSARLPNTKSLSTTASPLSRIQTNDNEHTTPTSSSNQIISVLPFLSALFVVNLLYS